MKTILLVATLLIISSAIACGPTWESTASKANTEQALDLGYAKITAKCNYKKEKVRIIAYPIGYKQGWLSAGYSQRFEKGQSWSKGEPWELFCAG